jgi:hypothetical protein
MPRLQLVNDLPTAARAIKPVILKVNSTEKTGIGINVPLSTMLDGIKDDAGHDVGQNQQPADRRHTIKISKSTASTAKQVGIADDDDRDAAKTKHDKPGEPVFLLR